MLRTSRRHTRSLLGLFAALTSLGLMWPAGIAAAPASPSGASSAAAQAENAERAPVVRGLGIRSMESGPSARGPVTPTHTLDANPANLGEASAPDGVGAQGAVPPLPTTAGFNGQPNAASFGLAPVEGIDQATSGIQPPDPWVAVGPDDVVQTVNSTLRFTNREGTERVANQSMTTFFDLANVLAPVGDPNPVLTLVTIDGTSGPRWTYDVAHNRWLGMVLGWHCGNVGTPLNTPIGFVFGAISLTGDPTGDYYQFLAQYNGFLPESPMFGTSGDKITLGVNEFALDDVANCQDAIAFSNVPEEESAGSLTTFDWANLLTFPAEPDIMYSFFFDQFALRPAVSPQGVSNTIFVVGEHLQADGIRSATTSDVSYMRVTGTTAGDNVDVSPPQDLSDAGIVSPFVDPPDPVEPGGVVAVDIVDRRPTDAIWQNNILTVASTYPCTSQARACARVTQIDTTAATPTLRGDTLINVPNSDTWYPGVGRSQSGILHVVYTQSAAGAGMSSYDRYQLPGDGGNEFSAEREIADGAAVNYGGNRWGRYVGVAQDPRDTNAVWQGNQYTKADGTWATRVTQLQTAGATFVPIAPVRMLDSRINLGTTGSFVSNVPKTVQIRGVLGIPAGAVAITGNLTVTGAQAAGYASITPLPVVTPATSTINFPTGNSRANNFTSPLSSTGAVSLVYKAVSGRQTHLILDVTGYFLNDATGDTYNVLGPVRLVDTRDGVGLGGRSFANVKREIPVAGQMGIDPLATAITANLTVADQNAAGFVTLSTLSPPDDPGTSTVNFPAAGATANGLTIKLSPAGSVFAVYEGPAGKSINLILDVTGYYKHDLAGSRFVPLTPGRRMDTRLPAPQEGLTGPFVANDPRTLVIEPYQGVPANATAITGNLTVVTPTRAGYVSMTTVEVDPPLTSTMNFAIGDTRANGVTGPLSGAGSVALIFKSSGSTHLILDLTGYFR